MTPDAIFAWVEQFFNSPRPYIMAPVHAWLEGGADFDKDIKPICERFLKKGKGAPGTLSWLNDDIQKSIAMRKMQPIYSATQSGAAMAGCSVGYSDIVKEKDRRWQEAAKSALQAFLNINPYASPESTRYARTQAQAIAQGLEWGRFGYDSMEASGYTHCNERLAAFKAHVRDCIGRGVIEIRVPEWVKQQEDV